MRKRIEPVGIPRIYAGEDVNYIVYVNCDIPFCTL